MPSRRIFGFAGSRPVSAVIVVLLALAALMLLAYRGYSVILIAPVAALGAVLLTAPQLVLPF
jgi:H+/gluconate symporter-like permease